MSTVTFTIRERIQAQGFCGLDSLLAVVGRTNIVTHAFQKHRQTVGAIPVVVRDQDAALENGPLPVALAWPGRLSAPAPPVAVLQKVRLQIVDSPWVPSADNPRG